MRMRMHFERVERNHSSDLVGKQRAGKIGTTNGARSINELERGRNVDLSGVQV